MKLKVIGLLLLTTALMLSVGCGGGGQVEIVDVRGHAVSTKTPIPSSGKVRPPTSIPTPTPDPSELVNRGVIVEKLVEAIVENEVPVGESPHRGKSV